MKIILQLMIYIYSTKSTGLYTNNVLL